MNPPVSHEDSAAPQRLVVEAILFDMDGTLVDSTEMVEQIWTEFAAAHGLDAREVIEFAHGRPSRDTIATYLPEGESVEHWLDTFAVWEAERFGDVIPIPGSVDFVASLPPTRWAVVTSALRLPAIDRLVSVGIPAPGVIIGADDVENGKPSPEGFAAAAAQLGFDPRDCVVFEDTAPGLRAALDAGCRAVVVGSLADAVTQGLARIPHWEGVRAVVNTHGAIEIEGLGITA